MTLIDPKPVPAFDASPFVTYNGEEDTTPTEAELVEDLPEREPMPIELAAAEKPLRRGKGYLRAEIAPEEKSDAAAEPQADFGAGIDEEEVSAKSIETAEDATSVSSPGDTIESVPSDRHDLDDSASEADGQSAASTDEDRDDGKPRRRRRRPRRRKSGHRSGRNNSGQDGSEDSSESSAQHAAEKDSATSGQTAEESGGSPNEGKTGRKKRRRRNRRRRPGGGGNPDSSNRSDSKDNSGSE